MRKIKFHERLIMIKSVRINFLSRFVCLPFLSTCRFVRILSIHISGVDLDESCGYTLRKDIYEQLGCIPVPQRAMMIDKGNPKSNMSRF